MGELIERGSNITLRACPVCSKNFIPTNEWAYRIGSKFYCRYNCYKQAGGDNRKKREYASSKRGVVIK